VRPLTPPSDGGPSIAIGQFVGVEVPYLSSDFDLLWTRVDVLFKRTVLIPDVGPQEVIIPLSIVGFFRFNCEGQISSFDVNVLNLERVNDPPELFRPQAIQAICGGITATCGASFPQYNGSFEECVTHMNSIPFGSSSNLRSDTVMCRSLHLLLAQFRPQLHCMHTGPDGGGKCIDTLYSEYYLPEKFY
jgi:hypothetical protein